MDSISYVYISWTTHVMWMIYITFERGDPKFSRTTARALAYHRDVRRFLSESLPQRWIDRVGKEDLALQFWPPRSPDLTPCHFFLRGFVKEVVYVPSLPTTLDDLKNRITTAMNSVTQDILLRVWNDFSYSLDITRAAWGRHIENL